MTEEISREALLIYLNDLRTMEMIIHESDDAIENIQKKQGDCKTDVLEHEKSKPKEPIKPNTPEEQIKREKKYSDSSSSSISYILWALFGVGMGIVSYVVFEGGFFGLSLLLIGVAAGVYCICLFKKNVIDRRKELLALYERLCEEYKKDMEKYKKNIEKYNQVHRKKLDFRDEILKKARTSIDEINAEKNDISEKLQEAYNANIIPLTFRNIQGIYYLYDYLSTSNQSLSEALMQCNLEAIKAKLDNVIELQGKAIVQQAQANQVLFEQNQHILETAQATMNNTAVAAKYAQISAVNSALLLKLQQKNLAYQRADFWLK